MVATASCTVLSDTDNSLPWRRAEGSADTEVTSRAGLRSKRSQRMRCGGHYRGPAGGRYPYTGGADRLGCCVPRGIARVVNDPRYVSGYHG